MNIPPGVARFAPYLAILSAILSLGLAAAWAGSRTLSPGDADSMLNGTIHAPDFPAGFAWLNTDHPLGMKKELRGQVVVLDFWTYCCINCMHVLPDLAYLEEKFANQPVAILGVHSAKFANEGRVENVRAALQRYRISHPVIVDEQMAIWNAYGVHSWPTLVVINPEGRVVGAISGEGNRELLIATISKLLEIGRAKGTLAAGPLKLQHEGSVQAASGLAFPGKVLADPASQRLFIADSNHHRILVSRLPDSQGRSELLATFGSGQPGTADGPAATAQFHNPQGLALAGSTLYVADTDNHLIRALDLEKLTVRTILGTGHQVFDREGGKSGRDQGLNSPWDLSVSGMNLLIAMAGNHQVWKLNLMSLMAEPILGSGRENLEDGHGTWAALAQPSGLALDGQTLYIADSEVSAIRRVDLASAKVATLVGSGLFDFGDIDGPAAHARLQHPLGVAVWNHQVLVADTYNHKIRQIDPVTGQVSSLLGGPPVPGLPAAKAQPALFEPGGLSVAGDRLFIADTNHHRILEVSLTDRRWQEVMLGGIATNEPPPETLRETSLNLALPLQIDLVAEFPSGTHLTPGGPITLRISQGEHLRLQKTLTPEQLSVTLEPESQIYGEPLMIEVTYTSCQDRGVCRPGQHRWLQPFRTLPGGENRLKLPLK